MKSFSELDSVECCLRALGVLVGAAVIILASLGGLLVYHTKVLDYKLLSPGQRHDLTAAAWYDHDEEVIDTGIENTVLALSLYIYDDEDQLNKQFALDYPEYDEELDGWSDCDHQPEKNVAFCDIHFARPRYVDGDVRMMTLGHEVWHAVTGNFHSE